MKRLQIDDRKIPPREKPYVVEDEGGCHLVSEMFCGDDESYEFDLGDRVEVTENYKKACDWYPDLIGQKGTVVNIISNSPIEKIPLDDVIYVVQFDNVFNRGQVDLADLQRWNITADEWLQEDANWSFLAEDKQLCKST